MVTKRIAVVGALLLLCACGAPDTKPPADALQRGLSADPETLDPQLARSVAATKVLGDLYEGLMTRDAAGELMLGVASNVIVSGDERDYRFELKGDARWSDGSAVTADDFVAAWRFLDEPEHAAFNRGLLAPVQRRDDGTLDVSAVDAQTLAVRLAAPRPDFLERLAHPALAPRHAEPGISNGAYALAERTPGGAIRLAANPHFHAAATVAIDSVVYQPFEQELTEYNAFQSGSLHITSRAPRAVFRAAERPPALRVAPYLGVVYLSFNMRNPPPLALRRALSSSVDRQALAEIVIGRGEQPAFGIVPPGTRNRDDRYAPLVPAAAGASPTEFEASAPVALTLYYATSDENRNVAAALQGMWAEALPGVSVALENLEFRVLLARARSGDFDGLVRGSWIADYNATSQFLDILATGAASNTSGFSDSRYDALLEAARAADSDARRASVYQAAERLLAEQVPVIPLYFMVSKHLVDTRVDGWRDNVLDLHYSRFLSLAEGTAD